MPEPAPVRVLVLTRDFPPRCGGGISTAVGAAARGLEGRGIELRVISLDRGGEAAPAGEEVLRIAGPQGLEAARAWGVEAEPAVVHVHDAMLWELGAAIARAVGAAAPCYTAHVLAGHQDRLRGLERATRTATAEAAALEGAAVVIAPSAAVAGLLEGRVRGKVVVLPLAIGGAPSSLPLSPERRENPDEACRVLFVGRFSDMTGIDTLVAMLPELAGGAVELVVAGGLPANPRAEARWRRRLEDGARAAGVGLELLGWLGPEALETAYRRCDVLLAPARFATFGLGVLEAMGRGLPVVATAVGGHPELVEDGQTGILCEPGDVTGLAGAVTALARDPEGRRRMGAAARERAARFSLSARCDALAALYRELAQ